MRGAHRNAFSCQFYVSRRHNLFSLPAPPPSPGGLFTPLELDEAALDTVVPLAVAPVHFAPLAAAVLPVRHFFLFEEVLRFEVFHGLRGGVYVLDCAHRPYLVDPPRHALKREVGQVARADTPPTVRAEQGHHEEQ